MLMLVARLRLSMLAAVAVVGIASFVLNVALIGSNPVATFYLPFTRAWELLAGAAWLAAGTDQPNRQRKQLARLGRAAAHCGGGRRARYQKRVSGLVGRFARCRRRAAAVRARGVVLPRVAGQPAAGPDRFVAPLYLWHWPLLVFFGIIKFATLTLLERGLIVGLSFALAWLPIGSSKSRCDLAVRARLKILSLCSGMVLVAAAGAVVVEGARIRFSAAGGNSRHGPCADRSRQNGGSMNACSILVMKPRLPIAASIVIAGR